jgi:hypothetical protein
MMKMRCGQRLLLMPQIYNDLCTHGRYAAQASKLWIPIPYNLRPYRLDTEVFLPDPLPSAGFTY